MTSVLEFSGGKDSLACLYLLKDRWDEITVLWMNAGAPFPETVALMESVRAMVPHFVESKANVELDIYENGWPVDVLPVKYGAGAGPLTDASGILMRPWNECCKTNIWEPMHKAALLLGATTIIRGQRNSERYKSPVRHGDEFFGIRYEFPLQEWSEQDVLNYLQEEEIELPAHYTETQTSLDCWLCTAYLDENAGKMRYMRNKHPEKYALVYGKLNQIAKATAKELVPLGQILTQ